MSLTVTTAADTKNWISLGALLDDLGLSLTETQAEEEDHFKRIIKSASDRCLAFINWGEIAFQRYLEHVAGADDNRLILSRTPIVNLIASTSRSLDEKIEATAGQAMTDVAVEDANAGILIRTAGFRRTARGATQLDMTLGPFHDPVAGQDLPNYEFDYESGYRMPDQTTPAPDGSGVEPDELPGDFQAAARSVAVQLWLGKGRTGDVERKKVENVEIEYFSARDKQEGERFGLTATAFYNLTPHRRMK